MNDHSAALNGCARHARAGQQQLVAHGPGCQAGAVRATHSQAVFELESALSSKPLQ
jgi:hypothetical protein